MKKTPFLLASAATIMMAAPDLAQGAAVDYFLKIEGVDGESNDSKHKNEIEILSFSWGATNTGTTAHGGGGGAG